MSILIDENTRFLIQGVTGKQGSLACKEMISAGSKVVCGVTPGKGGEKVENVPVYNSIKEAKQFHTINASVIFVPPKFAKTAIIEAIEEEIPLINVITENIPVHDMAYCLSLAKKNITIIGGTSSGIYSVGKAKSGPIASGKARIAFTPGNIGVISRSGGMSSETSLVLSQAGLGQSTVVSIGSDVLMGTTFLDLILLFENDIQTKGIALFGEIGGSSEEELANYLIERKNKKNPYSKPIVAFISGKSAELLPKVSLGHAGAIIEGNKGTRENKVKALKEAGVIIAEVHHQIGSLMKNALNVQNVQNNNNNNNARMKFKTRISKIEGEELFIRTEKLSDLIQNGSFTEAIFLLLTGRKADEKEKILFEKILISVIDHGMGTTSSLSSRFIASGGNNLNVAVGGGILSIGDFHGGAIEKAMRQFYSWKHLSEEEAAAQIKETISSKKVLFGFGHKVYKNNDPRVQAIMQEMTKLNFNSKFLKFKEIVEKKCLEIKGKNLPINIDGMIAILLCDMNFDPLISKGIFIIGRTPGLVAQSYEELKYEKPVRRLDEEEIEFVKE